MKINYTEKDLQDFETEIGNCFKQKQILAPIHLYDGNEKEMLDIFSLIQPDDWVCCTWRSHYQCLLKGVPKKIIKNDILNGRSIALCYPEYKIFSSAIVSGVLPIANGIAMGIKQRNLTNHVWCFVGDMTSETGCFHENWKYSYSHNFPITWIIEDNNLSVCTDTRKTWNLSELTYESYYSQMKESKIIHYKYSSKYPHAGAGERITF